jgi:hypothetical protein
LTSAAAAERSEEHLADVEPRCVDCGTGAPQLDQEQTLRSTLGWRLVFERQPDGTNKPLWRCPDCWQDYKQRKVSKEPVG